MRKSQINNVAKEETLHSKYNLVTRPNLYLVDVRFQVPLVGGPKVAEIADKVLGLLGLATGSLDGNSRGDRRGLKREG